jgi:hypothetical protein
MNTYYQRSPATLPSLFPAIMMRVSAFWACELEVVVTVAPQKFCAVIMLDKYGFFFIVVKKRRGGCWNYTFSFRFKQRQQLNQ